jgi:hypothetical protein
LAEAPGRQSQVPCFLSRFADAEPLLNRALAIWEKTLGPDQLDVAISLDNLDLVCRALGRAAEAEPLRRRTLAIRQKAGAQR